MLTVCAEILAAKANISEWFSHNGATKHVTNRYDVFKKFKKFEVPHFITAAGFELLPALGKGTISVLFNIGEQQKLILTDARHVPKINHSFVSVLAAQDRNPNTTEFCSSFTECRLKDDGRVVLQGAREQNGSLYKLINK